jgi:hypothetical protein
VEVWLEQLRDASRRKGGRETMSSGAVCCCCYCCCYCVCVCFEEFCYEEFCPRQLCYGERRRNGVMSQHDNETARKIFLCI